MEQPRKGRTGQNPKSDLKRLRKMLSPSLWGAANGGLRDGGLIRKAPDTFNFQRIAKGGGGKGPRQKTSNIVKKCQKVVRLFSTVFAQGKKRQKSTKNVKKIFDTFRQFSRGTIFPAPFGGLRNCLRHVMRAIWSVRPKCSHRCVSLTETSSKPAQTLKHTTQNSAEQTAMREQNGFNISRFKLFRRISYLRKSEDI